MAQLERSTGAAPARAEHVPPETDAENLPALLGRLGDDVMTLVDAKLGLFKVELKEDAACITIQNAPPSLDLPVAYVSMIPIRGFTGRSRVQGERCLYYEQNTP